MMKRTHAMAMLSALAALTLAQPARADNSVVTVEQIGGPSTATITQNGPAKTALLLQSGGGNLATISQTTVSGGYVDLNMTGVANVAHVTQFGDLFNGSSNTATLSQYGDRNTLDLVQEAWTGAGNSVTMHQSGNDNYSLLRQTGADNDLSLTQDVGNNWADISQTGVNQSIAVTQAGGASVTISQTQ
ncbi:MAG: hypothetical protein IPN84_10205 [Sphingomonadales bacterium]|nr:hypothetical protein [Sphingomonadales bacterium]